MATNVDKEQNLEKSVVISEHLAESITGSGKFQPLEVQEEYYETNEYRIDWKDAIFLQFQIIWESVIITTVLIQILLIIYESFYNRSIAKKRVYNLFMYSCDILYLVDTILYILHRGMPHHRSLKEYPPKNGLFLIFDILSLLPVYETYLLVMATSRNFTSDEKVRSILEYRTVFRIYRVFDYFIKVRYTAGVNQLMVSLIFHIVDIILLTHVAGALWFAMRCYACPGHNWTEFLRAYQFDSDKPAHWLTICFTTMGEILAHNSRGLVRGTNFYERSLVLSLMVLGFVLHYVLFIGRLTGVYMKIFRRRFLFHNNLACIKRKLQELEINEEWTTKTIEYYRMYWKRHQGIIRMPAIFLNLPTNLQKEVTLDIFWEALRHTHFYGRENQAFKRHISLKMKSEFYLAGDYVYTLGKIKSKMVYISSGILQVLTAEDEESPIISFSSGTVMGELSCVMPYKSNVYIKCATYCELHTLEFADVFEVLRNHQGKTKHIRTKCLDRITRAQTLKNSYDTIVVAKGQDEVGGNIKWIKLQWRTCSKMKDDIMKKATSHVSYYYRSRYLDLLVLSKKVELKTREICLSNTCPFILASNSSFIQFARVVVLIAVVLQCTIIPFYIAFMKRMSNALFAFCFFLDAMYIIDVYLKVSTIIEREGRIESKMSRIMSARFREIRFMADILAAIPLDMVYYILFGHYSRILKTNRLLKVYGIFDYISKQEKDIWLSTLTLSMLRNFTMYLISGYWWVCLMYAVTCFESECNYYGWFLYNTRLDKAAGIGNPLEKLPFLESLYYVLFTYYGVGLSNKYPFVLSEMVLHYGVVMTGYLVCSFCFAQLCASHILHKEDRHKYQESLDIMKQFLKQNKIQKELQQRIMTVMEFSWYYNRNKEAFGEDGILKDASVELSKQIETERRIQFITKVPLFSGLEKKLLSSLNDHCSVKTLPEDFLVLVKGKRSTGLHIILRGYCKLVSTVPGDKERAAHSVLKPGDAFPVVEVLHQAPSQVTVRTSTTVEIITIKYSDIKKILFSNRTIENEIREGLKKHIKTPKGLLLAGQERRLPVLIPEQRSQGVGDYFSYKIFDTDFTSTEEQRYLAPFKKLGKLSLIRYVLRRKTIDPHSRFFTTWEIFRCIFAFIRVFIVLTYVNILAPYRGAFLKTFIAFLDLTNILDIYIRLHCRYHNHLGILVTHASATALHYLKTSFILDLLAVFPLKFFRMNELLGYNRRAELMTYMMIFTRPLQLYRIAGAFAYLEADITNRGILICGAKLGAFLTILILTVALIIQLATCEQPRMQNGLIVILCNNNSWLFTTNMNDKLAVKFMYMKCILAAISTITSTTYGFFSARFLHEATLFFLLGILFAILRWVIIAKILSFRVGGSSALTMYQGQVNTFLKFVETEVIHDEIIMEVIAHYEFMWQSTKGGCIVTTLNSLYGNLHEEVVYSLYKDALGLVEILQGADETLLKELGTVIVLRNFKKDSPVIQCNDVQSMLYIVNKGKVQITLAGQKLCVLGTGGLFGCLKRQGKTRQTITATAMVHVVLLEINSNSFYNIVSVFPEIQQRLKRMDFFNQEYSENRTQFSTTPRKSVLRPSITNNALAQMVSTFNRNLHFLVYHKSKFYTWFEYITCVHIAPISSILIMLLAIVLTNNPQWQNLRRCIIYTTDAIFIFKIILEFHLTYVHKETGVTVIDIKSIRRKYLRSSWLYASICMCIPFELLMLIVKRKGVYFELCIINRILRAIFLSRYYYRNKDKLNVKMHLRWTYLVYCVCVSVQAAATMWWFVSCTNGICHLSTSYFRHHGAVVEPETSSLHSALLTYLFVINLLTGTGWRNIGPTTISETVTTTLIIFCFQLTLVSLITVFTTILTIQGQGFNRYEYNILQLRSYLEARKLSKPILDKVWIYSLQLWKRHRGECIPSIILEMPPYLKQHIMLELYGHHLRRHCLFQNTHDDFLRQLAVYLIHCVFFPENYIVEFGDKDGCMYFVHEGEVEVCYKDVNTEMVNRILRKGDSFGEAQGLYNICYNFSYKARTVVKVLILKHADWKFLLNWFPASKEMIETQAAEHRIVDSSTIDGVQA